jgi:hypothetical protein
MNAFSPEFSAYWLEESAGTGEQAPEIPVPAEPLSPTQQTALEELVERVNAARSVV